MDRDTWSTLYKKLTTAYQKPVSAEQAGVYFEALQTLPSGVIVDAVTTTIKEGKHWPRAADIRERALSILASRTTHPSECDECQGTGWIAAADQVHFTWTYTNYVQRCLQCRPPLKGAA